MCPRLQGLLQSASGAHEFGGVVTRTSIWHFVVLRDPSSYCAEVCAETRDIRTKLRALLDDPAAAQTAREWDDHHGRHLGPYDLTDLEWWFQSFTLLRNRIARGGDVSPDDFDFDNGIPHVWHAEWNLRRAIKQTVANAGHEDVLLDVFERLARRFARGDGA